MELSATSGALSLGIKRLSVFVGSTCAKKKSISAHMIDDLLSLRSMLHFETDSVTCKIVES